MQVNDLIFKLFHVCIIHEDNFQLLHFTFTFKNWEKTRCESSNLTWSYSRFSFLSVQEWSLRYNLCEWSFQLWCSAVTKKTGGKGGKKKGKTPPITPPSATHFTEESIFKMLEMGPRPITTLLVVKPFIMAKRNLARLFKELLRESFCFVALRLVTITEAEAALMQPETVSLVI